MADKVSKDRFNKTSTHPLQSWEWGEFRKAAGNEVIRLSFGPARQSWSKATTGGQVTLHKIPKTKYKVGAFIKGPKPTKTMINELKRLAREENLIFIKMEPNILRNEKLKDKKSKPQLKSQKLIKLLKDSGAVKGKTLFTPTTFLIDLKPSEDDLMKNFSSKTRYNIRLAKRKGVEVVEDNSKKAFEKYIKLTRETVERQGFYAHTEKYHRLMWKYLHIKPTSENRQPIARLLVAKYKGETVSAWIVFVWKNFLYYPYGASSDKHKNVMANNLMMWEAIRYGKSLGLSTFDLWGREVGKGFTKFKEGYNPKVVEFLGTWDLKTSPLYSTYRLADTIRWSLLRTKSKFSKPSF